MFFLCCCCAHQFARVVLCVVVMMTVVVMVLFCRRRRFGRERARSNATHTAKCVAAGVCERGLTAAMMCRGGPTTTPVQLLHQQQTHLQRGHPPCLPQTRQSRADRLRSCGRHLNSTRPPQQHERGCYLPRTVAVVLPTCTVQFWTGVGESSGRDCNSDCWGMMICRLAPSPVNLERLSLCLLF